MTHILMLGGGLTGLSAAMLLARDGHTVTLLERDPGPPPIGSAWRSWDRPGVAQFRNAHFMLPRWHAVMRDELPEVLVELRAAGGTPINLAALLPPEVGGPRRAGDERFDTLTARRPVLEAALAAVAARTPGLVLRRGVAVTGLVADGSHVRGVRTRDGGTLTADLVVDGTGRRTPAAGWLAAAGLPAAAEERQESGFVYYGRHFRGERPAVRGPLLQHYDSVSVLTLPGDRDTWAVAFVTGSRDRALRALRDPRRWDAALDRFPLLAHWRAGKPMTGVDVMAGLDDRCRSPVPDGGPVVTGLVAVGDAAFCTNPSLGRGAAIGLLHARTLRDVLRDVGPDRPGDLARRFAARTAAVVEPLYRATRWFDRHRLAEIRADVAGRPYAPADPRWAMARATYTAGLRHPDAARAQLALAAMLGTPDEILADPALAATIRSVAAGAPRYPLPGPGRDELLAAVTGGGSPTSSPEPVRTGPV
jgi:2-polyprenyl-6-methoxyphenol hydroxylase-like FAD-dependent oxidoreductase